MKKISYEGKSKRNQKIKNQDEDDIINIIIIILSYLKFIN